MDEFMNENKEQSIDMAEIYRQNYLDALDEVRNLNYRVRELEIENRLLRNDINRAENHIIYSAGTEEE